MDGWMDGGVSPLLRLLDGLRQVDGVRGDLHFSDAAEEICDEDTSWVPEEEVGPVARGGHALTPWTHFELGEEITSSV